MQSPRSTRYNFGLSAKAKTRKALDTVLRLAISGGILALILWKVNPARVLGELREANIWFLVACMLIAFCGYILAGFRWHLFMRAHGLRVSLPDTLWAMFAGLFIGNFLPAGAGVDVVRGAWVVRQHGELAKVSASIVADRLTGFIILAFTALAAVWVHSNLRIPVAILALLLLAGTIMAFTDPFISIAEKTIGRLRWLRLGERAMSFLKAFHFYGKKPCLLFTTFFLAFALQVVFALIGHLVAGALGYWPPIWTSIIFVPTVNLLAMLPVSVSGFGVREGAFLFLFRPYMPDEACIALSLTYFAVCLVPTATGIAPLWFRRK
ncbi:MAG: lysylphosphatidylglycerol synthase transmembrane domain-containing protein [candidate division WOR-3 bacterium]